MKALEEQRKSEDDVEAKIRLEETRAQLAAAKLNMEAEGKRIEEERKEAERRKQEKAETTRQTSSVSTGIGGKWVPRHMRGGASAAVDRGRLGAKSSKLDPLDDEAFPDLGFSSAPEPKAPKMPKQVKKKPVVKAAVLEKKEPPAVPVAIETEEKVVSTPEVQPVATVPVAKPVVKKKKKKDLSSFKSS